MKLIRILLAALVCVALAVTVAACGDDNNDKGSGASPSTTKTDGGDTAGGPSQATIDLALKYTGGTAGAADSAKPPVKVGFTTMIGGTPEFPEHVETAKAFTKFINEKLGGIGGAPLELVICTMQTEEDGQKCGAEFLDANVPVINQSLAVIGNASLYKTVVPKIPVITGSPATGPDATTPGVYNFTGGGPGVIYGMAKDAANLGLKNLALVSVGNPGGKFTMEQIAVPALDQVGVKHSKVVYYSDTATTPDIVAAVQNAGGSKADGIFFDPSTPAQCTSLVKAIKQLNLDVPVIATVLCNGQSVVDSAGGDSGLEGWHMWGFNENPRVTGVPEVDAYNDVMKAYGAESFAFTGFGSVAARDLLTIAAFGNAAGGEITPDVMKQAILAFRGPAWMVPGGQNCEKPPVKETPSVCGDVGVGSAIEGGKWKSLGAIKVGS
ncbi:unannotated protein [freshwater metagenome]|uniref:Unannotated protein n=1 Tax=freshwater metagenome TaxID=449393 RepID=A0A6J7JBH8_9ZZZZ|nr:hypothetical protein [Actinomycetota bacterium]